MKLLATILLLACTASGGDFGASIVNLVDTRVGSAASDSPTASIFGAGGEVLGNVVPCVTTPGGMTGWTPQTLISDQKGAAPYYYSDPKWLGFRASHWMSGSATQDFGSFYIIPGNPDGEPMDHSIEEAHPDYYRYGEWEITSTGRCAILRLGGCKELLIGINTEREGEASFENGEFRARNLVHRIYQGWGKSAGFSSWAVAEFSQEPIRAEVVKNGLAVKFTFSGEQPLLVKMGTSFTGYEGASDNLSCEISGWDFDEVRRNLAAVWEEKFSKIEVSREDEEAFRHFYGSRGRAYLLPRVFSDCSGKVPSTEAFPCDDSPEALPVYDTFSMWDTFRAEHPLMTILEPEISGLMMQSLVRMYEKGGWLPIFPCWGSYTSAMIGDHCVSVLTDALVKELEFDRKTAWKAIEQNAFCTPSNDLYVDGRGRRALESYIKYGYIPLEDEVEDAFHRREQVSRTLEYAYDDWCAARFAFRTGHFITGIKLLRRSRNWKNVFDPATNYPQGRHSDGTFLDEPGNYLSKTGFITEGTPCHYSWYVPHDVKGLVNLVGKEEFEARLDSMFTCQRYWHGNEPCHQVIYMYDWIGRPDKAAERVGETLRGEYRNTPGGLSGNDDCGQMSAWYVFSSLGFYPVCPGSGEYALGAPAFEKIVLHLDNGRDLTITRSDSPSWSCSLNGKKLRKPFIRHSDIVRGGLLDF